MSNIGKMLLLNREKIKIKKQKIIMVSIHVKEKHNHEANFHVKTGASNSKPSLILWLKRLRTLWRRKTKPKDLGLYSSFFGSEIDMVVVV